MSAASWMFLCREYQYELSAASAQKPTITGIISVLMIAMLPDRERRNRRTYLLVRELKTIAHPSSCRRAVFAFAPERRNYAGVRNLSRNSAAFGQRSANAGHANYRR